MSSAQLCLGQALDLTYAFIKEDNSMSTRFDKLPPRPEYIAAVKAALKRGDESSIRDLSRETGLSQTQSLSALDYLITLGEIEVRRQNQTPQQFTAYPSRPRDILAGQV